MSPSRAPSHRRAAGRRHRVGHVMRRERDHPRRPRRGRGARRDRRHRPGASGDRHPDRRAAPVDRGPCPRASRHTCYSALEVATGLLLSHPRNSAPSGRRRARRSRGTSSSRCSRGPSWGSTSPCSRSIPMPTSASSAPSSPGCPRIGPRPSRSARSRSTPCCSRRSPRSGPGSCPTGCGSRSTGSPPWPSCLPGSTACSPAPTAEPLTPFYLATGLPILAAIAHRWWTARTAPRRAEVPVTPNLALARPQPAPVTVEES